jgi:hypothetical protein
MKYELSKQEQKNYCVPAVLQAVLRRHNCILTQEQIANELTPSKHGFEINDEAIRKLFERKGLGYVHYVWNEVPHGEYDEVLNEVPRGNDVFVGLSHHVLLVSEFDFPSIRLMDPSGLTVQAKSLNELLVEMAETEGLFGVVKRQ